VKKRSGTYKSRKKNISTKTHISTALILVDQTPFLKKALSRCKRLRNELNKKQKLLSEYEDKDVTAFQQWLNHTFGAKLSKMRELSETLNQYRFILNQLYSCRFFCYEKLPEVHKELFERKKDGTLFQFVLPTDGNPFQAKADEDMGDGWEDEEEEDDDDWDDDDWDMEDIFDELFGGKGGHSNSAEEEERYFNLGNLQARNSLHASDHLKLKKCYRSLAKRLHPDHSTLDESLREKRWHEIQEAYQNNDLEALLRVEAICDVDGTDLSIELGLARLTDLANYHQSHLQPIRRELSHVKREIAFGFNKTGANNKISAQMKSELNYQTYDLEADIAEIQQIADSILEEFLAEQERQKRSTNKSVSRPKSKKHQFVEDARQMNLF
jgi:hypothetical protein